ncbi:unnamed protein product [Effrenium voratum]|nr:unnamed protein product [Effrenium voratum]
MSADGVPVREASWRLLCRRPQIFACDSFLTPEECLAIRRLAEVNIPVQCSSKMRVDLEITPGGGDHAVLRAIERRIEALSGLKAHPGEMPWAVHFTPGAEEEPEKRVNLGLHLDTNNTREKRWLTFIIYLQTTPAHQGGHTLFPLAQTKGSKVTHLGDTLLAANLQHTGPALNSHLQEAAEQLLARGEVLAQKALVEESARPGLAVAPREGLCVAFWTRLPGSGAVDCASWHGGAAVTGEGGKWTLQKFREAPPEALKDCCVEAFARDHGRLRLPCCAGGVLFLDEEDREAAEPESKRMAATALGNLSKTCRCRVFFSPVNLNARPGSGLVVLPLRWC